MIQTIQVPRPYLPPPPSRRRRAGVGDVGPGLVAAGATGASTGIATGNIVAGSVAAGLMAGAAFDPEPISKAILGALAGLVALFTKVFGGCGQTCIAATKIVDQVESQYLKPNLAQYQALPLHLYSLQQQALQLFDKAWGLVLQGCSNPALGSAGQRCISERQRGGTSSWCPNCNWFTLYRDPIANDPNVVMDTATPISVDAANQTVTFPTISGGSVTVPYSVSPGMLLGEGTAGESGNPGSGAGVNPDGSSAVGSSFGSRFPFPVLLGGGLLLLLAAVGD